MIHALMQVDPAVRFQHSRLVRDYAGQDAHLLDMLNSYLAEYARFCRFSPEETLQHYYAFVYRYIDDLRTFASSGLFPFQNKNSRTDAMPRSTYDIFLILSSLLQKHRFHIMKSVYESTASAGRCLVVGVGSGLELLLLRTKFAHIDAYDLSISDFCKQKFGAAGLYEEEFSVSSQREYGAIYAIELLEHLERPYALLRDFHRSLAKGGRLIVTIARNVPQFDHLQSFSDVAEFEGNAKHLGFEVLHKEVIPHHYAFFEVDAGNCLYLLTRTA